jgi:GMP synthase (glutamine-hydrolysing)
VRPEGGSVRRALAIRHVAFEDLGLFAPVLTDRGFHIDYVEAAGGLSNVDGSEPELLIALGGPIGAYDDASYPFLKDELRLLERRLAADRPTLGICLGAQLMAWALRARVYPGPRKEIGWAPLTLTPEGRRSPLQRLTAGCGQVLHWHGDTFDLPAGAVRLASTPVYENQAFCWRNTALALQFHPEVTADGLEHWFVGHACEIAAAPDLSVSDLRAETRRCAPELVGNGQAFFSAWLDGVGL